MRALQLVQVAAEAEKIRLQRKAVRELKRVVYAAMATIFALGILCMLHVLAWSLLVPHVGPVWTSIILLGTDVVIVMAFGFLAVRSKPGRAERDAEDIRRGALRQVRQSLALSAVVPAVGLLTGRGLSSAVTDRTGWLGRRRKRSSPA